LLVITASHRRALSMRLQVARAKTVLAAVRWSAGTRVREVE
jgi:hypothetical protein